LDDLFLQRSEASSDDLIIVSSSLPCGPQSLRINTGIELESNMVDIELIPFAIDGACDKTLLKRKAWLYDYLAGIRSRGIALVVFGLELSESLRQL
jgi:hypothetical protein